MQYVKDVSNQSFKSDPAASTFGVVDASRPPYPGHSSRNQASRRGERADASLPRCSSHKRASPVEVLGARFRGPRLAEKPRGKGPSHPTPSLKARFGPEAALPGTGMKETHFRRIHDLPRLLLTPAAGAGAGHRDTKPES